MTMKKNLYFYIFLSCVVTCLQAITADSSADIPAAHDLERELHHAHHEKLSLIKKADRKDHFGIIMDCHKRICAIETHGAKTVDRNGFQECTTAKCQIMRLIHQISFNVQALMKSMSQSDVDKIKQINEQIYKLKTLLKKYGIDDKTFESHPLSIYL